MDEHGTPKVTLNYVAKVLDYRDKIENDLKKSVGYTEVRHVQTNTADPHADAVDSTGRSK
ncbi:MAG: hypothetical protein R6V67_01245 [Spirochaetia bacterium]